MKKILIILVLGLFLVSCGKSSVQPTVTINPTSTSIVQPVGGLNCASASFSNFSMYTTQFTVTVTDSNGNPAPRASLSISYPLSYIQFYSDPLGSTQLGNPFSATTDDSGSYPFYVGYAYWVPVSNTGTVQLYSDNIQVNASGVGSAQSTFTVSTSPNQAPLIISPSVTRELPGGIVLFTVASGTPPYKITSNPYTPSTSSVPLCGGGFTVTIPSTATSGATDTVTAVDSTGASASATITVQ